MSRSFVVGIGLALVLSVSQSVARAGVLVSRIGSPSFQVAEHHLYAAPTNVFPSLFPLHFPDRLQHGPPSYDYGQEFADGLNNLGLMDKDVFTDDDFAAPNAVHLGLTLVPAVGAPNGSSFDFENGPVIPNSVHPISFAGDVSLNGAIYEEGAFGGLLTPQSGVGTPDLPRGRSHFVLDVWENTSFAPDGLSNFRGDYQYRLLLREAGGQNGYDVVANFQVVPEPSGFAQFGLVLMAFLGYGSLRRKSV